MYKLQLISEARRICPQVIIVLGEDLTRFRNASKDLHSFLAAFVWSGRCERLGFDEAWLDCTDMIDYNITCLNLRHLELSFFHIDKHDPSAGFSFDASTISGEVFPAAAAAADSSAVESSVRPPNEGIDPLELRLRLASHLASFLRAELEREKGYTATVGVSINKLLSKLVGSLHKPNSQTTLLPPYNRSPSSADGSNVTKFLDVQDIGKLPGIGFKISQRLRESVLGRPAAFEDGLVYGPSRESVSVREVRVFPGMGPSTLNRVLGGPGWPKDIGRKVFDILLGKDDSEVCVTKKVPTQISVEDSYLSLDTYPCSKNCIPREVRGICLW